MIREFVLLPLLAIIVVTGSAQVQTSAGAATDPEGVKKEVLKVENDLDQALLASDSHALDRIWADNFLYLGTSGEVKAKGERLAEIQSGTIKYDFIKNDDVRLSAHGDTVVLSGRSTTTLLLRDKSSWGAGGTSHFISPGRLSGNALFSHVYVKLHGRWQLVLEHMTYITEK
jgi:hypothetical protein